MIDGKYIYFINEIKICVDETNRSLLFLFFVNSEKSTYTVMKKSNIVSPLHSYDLGNDIKKIGKKEDHSL